MMKTNPSHCTCGGIHLNGDNVIFILVFLHRSMFKEENNPLLPQSICIYSMKLGEGWKESLMGQYMSVR